MDTAEEHYRALAHTVQPAILHRGADYVRRSAVMGLSVEREKDGTLTLEAVVRGTRLYDTRVVHVAGAPRCNITCTCPCDFPCKHGAAVMLTYLKSVRSEAEHNREPRPSFFDDVGAGAQFDPATFMVVLHAHADFAPSLHPRNRDYTYLDPETVRRRYTLSDDASTLLMIIEHCGYASSYSFDAEDLPLARLFSLIERLRMPVMLESTAHEARQITLVSDPMPLPVAIAPRTLDRGFDDEFAHLEVVLSLPEEREPGPHRPIATFHAIGPYVLRETSTKLALYEAGEMLAPLIARAEPYYEYTEEGARRYAFTGTLLYGNEIPGLNEVSPEQIPGLELSIDTTVASIQVHREKPVPVLRVAYDREQSVLTATPCADYGPWQSELSDTISIKAGATPVYGFKRTAHHNPAHTLAHTNKTLHLITRDEKAEVALYKRFQKHHEALGLTKRLKCTKRGAEAVRRYLDEHWPSVRAVAEREGIAVEFTNATLAERSERITAHFMSELDAARDWLHFDVTLTLGDERVPLSALYALIDGAEPFITKQDGSVVEVENKPELERLVRLLRSFREQEAGGFDGTLARAPELAYVATSSPDYSATHSKEVRRFLERAATGKPLKAVRLTEKLKALLRPYQRAGVTWLYFLRSHHFGGILADDMGLGKTLQTLTVLARERTPDTPSLVVCPKSLVHNWVQEAETFFPTLRVLAYDGSPSEREALRATRNTHDLVVMSYHTFLQDHAALTSDIRYNYAVLDEAQYIKNPATKLAQRVKEIPAQYRLALSGTPLENHVFEVWSIFDFLMPGFLGSHEDFKQRYHKPIMEEGNTQALEELRAKVAPFMLRRTKNEVLTELPPKVEQTRECALADEQNALYHEVLREVRGTVLGAVEEKGYKGAQIHILAGLTKLRQVCNHPALLMKDREPSEFESSKLDACLELIEEVRQSGRKVLVFSQFTGMLDILAQALKEQDIGHVSLTGKTQKRAAVIARFNDDEAVTAFLISLKAGGTGLNLTAADTVIIFDPWWNPSVERQAIDRTHRMGQTQSVNVYRLLTTGTIEEKIEALKEKKRGLFDAVVSDTGELTKKLTWDDVKALFEG